MADVNGTLLTTTTFDPLREDAPGKVTDEFTYDVLLEDGIAVEVFNSTNPSGGGGGAQVVRQNPELTRSSP